MAHELTDPSAGAQPNPSLLLYGAGDALQCRARALVEEGSLDSLVLESDPGAFLESVEAKHPDVIFADLGDEPDAVLDMIEKLPTPRPHLLMSGSAEHGRAILRAMRLGVVEFFEEAPDERHLRSVIQRIAAEVVAESEAKGPARVVAVMGAKGGIGTTVVACQIAARLHAGGARVAVVDLCLPLGDVALYFDVQAPYTLADIARGDRKLDATYLRTLMEGKDGGVRILASPTRAEEAELVDGSHVEQVIGLLRRDFDWVILDVSRIFGEPTVRALDLSDQILLVTQLDVSTLHHSRHLLELLERLGHTGDRVRLIASAYDPDGPVGDNDVVEFLDRELDFRIPEDAATAAATTNQGASVAQVAPRSPMARAFAELHRNLHAWSDRKVPEEKQSPGALARAVSLFKRS